MTDESLRASIFEELTDIKKDLEKEVKFLQKEKKTNPYAWEALPIFHEILKKVKVLLTRRKGDRDITHILNDCARQVFCLAVVVSNDDLLRLKARQYAEKLAKLLPDTSTIQIELSLKRGVEIEAQKPRKKEKNFSRTSKRKSLTSNYRQLSLEFFAVEPPLS